MSKTIPHKHLRTDQNGMAAIFITMVMMIVISLIVLGFAQIAQREQREALDRQLSTQAFYAAESGVNAAIKFYVANAPMPGAASPKTTCPQGGGFYGGIGNYNLDTSASTGNVAITCLLINPAPNSLVYGSVGTTSQVVPVATGTATTISSITLTWQDTTTPSSPTFANCNNSGGNNTSLPPATPGGWNTSCAAGLLRIDVASGTATGRSTLDGATFTVFLYPTTSGGSPSLTFSSPPSNPLVPTTCGPLPGTTTCTMTINLPTGASAASTYYLRLQSLYSNSTVTVQAFNSSAPASPLALADAQLEVDSTGRASDVLRRIQVRKSLVTSGTAVPDDTIESTSSICKRFSDYSGVVPTVDSTYSDPACQIP